MNTIYRILGTSVLSVVLAKAGIAADYKKNPFTLAYDGAITKNEPGKVNIHAVRYDLSGLSIAANIYTPPGYDSKKSYAAIVIAHPNGGGERAGCWPVCPTSV